MILHTETIAQHEAITAARLHESTRETGTLELEFAGFLPAWAGYMEPVSLYHKGRLVFHGKITSRPQSSGDSITSTVTVSNILWLLDHSTLAQQLAEISEAASESSSGSSGNLVKAGKGYSFRSLTEGVAIRARSWTPSTAQSGGEGVIAASLSKGMQGRVLATPSGSKGGVITTETAMRKARETNPDLLRLVDYEAGTVRLASVAEAATLTLDTDAVRVVSMDLEPQHEHCVAGVALVLTGESGAISSVIVHPSGLAVTSLGVKVFQCNATNATDANISAWTAVARQYYEAASVLQHGGTITVRTDDLETSPLGCCIHLTGRGCAPEWSSMVAIVNAVDWDLMDGTLGMTLGYDVSDPEFAEPTALDGGEDMSDEPGSDDGGDEPGGDDSEDADSSDSFDDTWETVDVSGSASLSESMSGSEPGSTPGSEPGSTPGSKPGSTPGSEPGSTPGSKPGSTPGSCCPNCSAKLEEMQRLIDDLKKRVDDLENGECGCVAQVQAAIDAALVTVPVTLGGSASEEVQTNANGTITVTANWSY